MQNTQDHAIVVGISDYAAYPKLKAAAGDALAFAEWLRSPDGADIPADQVKVIISGDMKLPAELKDFYPVKDDIDDALSAIIKKLGGAPGRRFYLYFSGHGCAPSAEALLLLLANTSQEMLQRNVGAARYRSFLHDAALFDELIFILDCCLGYEPLWANPQEPSLTPIPRSANAPRVRHFMALGTEFGKLSFAPDDPDKCSFFTKYLIEGLKNARNADGSVTAQSLAYYVKPKVMAETAGNKKEYQQVPVIPIEPNIVFKPGTPGKALGGRLLNFTIPEEWTRPLELQDGAFNPVRRVNGDAKKFQIVLMPGLYQIIYPADAAAAENVVRQTLRVTPTGASARVALEMHPGKEQYDV